MTDLALITGANGFVGRALVERLEAGSFPIRRAARSPRPDCVAVGSIDGDTNWTEALRGASHVVHLAARVHVMVDRSQDPLAEFRRVNVEGTASLARQAAAAGVRRFVYISSVKVNGERTESGRPFSPQDPPHPSDPYGVSKHEAEQRMWEVAEATGLEVVVVRPVLVYGPGVGGNLEVMMRAIRRGVPLPFGAVHNRRSLLGVRNLADLIAACLREPAAANQTYLASDGEDVSTPDLIRQLARSMGRSPRLWPVPARFLRLAGWVGRRSDMVDRLLGSLQVDNEKARRELGWSPPVPLADGLAETARSFLAGRPAGA